MVEAGPVHSIGELLESPGVKEADCLELSICDAVHFRLLTPHPLFELTELKLLNYGGALFKGYANLRMEVEESMRGSLLKDKIDACCTRQPDWLNQRHLIYAVELEVWMDVSYPNPWTLAVYHEALMRGKSVSIPRLGPFSENFHDLLREKNGYERILKPGPEVRKVRVHIGEQSFIPDAYLHLVTEKRVDEEHAFGEFDDLGSQLANGLQAKMVEDLSARGLNDNICRSQLFGYRLIGPLVVLQVQEFVNLTGPVAFAGLGALFLLRLTEAMRPYWPTLPPICLPRDTDQIISVFPGKNACQFLLPGSIDEDSPSVLSFSGNPHARLLFPGFNLFMKAALLGPEAPRIQAAAMAFAADYALMTRGLQTPLPSAPVLREWHRAILSPKEDFLHWADMIGLLPGFNPLQAAMNIRSQLELSPWPTAAYRMARPLIRWWLRRRCADCVKEIEAARLEQE